jgi:hypothetical protein
MINELNSYRVKYFIEDIIPDPFRTAASINGRQTILPAPADARF